MKTLTLNLILLLVLLSCDDNKMQPSDTGITVTRSITEYANAILAAEQGAGDPFTISDFYVEGDSAYLSVSYSGGCNRHSFQVIWGESYIKTYPPQADLLVIHNAHDDACEALITETLTFDLRELIGPSDYETIIINALNGSSLSDSGKTDNWNPSDINVYKVSFPEGDQCQVEVTASTVICGTGLYENLWLALNDSVSAGVEGIYFKKWLQPVAINDDLKNFRPVEGKKYLVGARVREKHPYTDVVVCLAYSGPSVPVEITCIKELN